MTPGCAPVAMECVGATAGAGPLAGTAGSPSPLGWAGRGQARALRVPERANCRPELFVDFPRGKGSSGSRRDCGAHLRAC
eukprot:7272848-Alexandrium_andersonii.AAC.1